MASRSGLRSGARSDPFENVQQANRVRRRDAYSEIRQRLPRSVEFLAILLLHLHSLTTRIGWRRIPRSTAVLSRPAKILRRGSVAFGVRIGRRVEHAVAAPDPDPRAERSAGVASP
jgi:hypothetical protein